MESCSEVQLRSGGPRSGITVQMTWKRSLPGLRVARESEAFRPRALACNATGVGSPHDKPLSWRWKRHASTVMALCQRPSGVLESKLSWLLPPSQPSI